MKKAVTKKVKKVKQVASKARRGVSKKPKTLEGRYLATATEHVQPKLDQRINAMPKVVLSSREEELKVEDDDLMLEVMTEATSPVEELEQLSLAESIDSFNTKTTSDGYAFSVGEKPEESRVKAIERDRKVELKLSIRAMVNSFRDSMETQLINLSAKVEGQLKPLVDAVSTIAVARKDFTYQLHDFQDQLNIALKLNDELEPMEIGFGYEDYFEGQVDGVAGMDEMLAEAIDEGETWKQDIPTTEYNLGPRAVPDSKKVN